MNNFWKKNWEQTRKRLINWWEGNGFILCILSPRDNPIEDIDRPDKPDNLLDKWTDPEYRLKNAEYKMANNYYETEAFPFFDTEIGPGNLATFIGSKPEFREDTVWFNKFIDNPDQYPELKFDPDNKWFKNQLEIINKGIKESDGRFLVSMPDLVENMDILASMRGANELLMDLIERPEFVKEKINEINKIYFQVFDIFYEKIRDKWNGNCYSVFNIWGPGKTAKIQCDTSAMFSPQMLTEFAIPALTEQCEWLDYSLYHLDGTQAMIHLDYILQIDQLNAIEWTPQAGIPTGGNPEWYDLYKKILAGGKSVQAVGVKPDEVIPLLNAVGTNGIFILAEADSQSEAIDIYEKVEKFR